jgi:hypothetical protein
VKALLAGVGRASAAGVLMTSTSVTITKEQIEEALREWIAAGHLPRPLPVGSARVANIKFSGIPREGVSCGIEYD